MIDRGERMSIIKELKDRITIKIKEIGYDIEELHFQESNRQDLGEYQIS